MNRLQSSASTVSNISASHAAPVTPSSVSLVQFGSFEYKSASTYSIAESVNGSESTKLADVLNILDSEDETCIFIVRKISKLGFSAYDSLNLYFAKYGSVKKVLLLPSRGKGDSRNRPASMGFVVMHSATDCQGVLRSENHRINFVDIQVQKFVRNTKVQVSDGITVTNAYIPAGYIGGSPAPVISEDSFSLATPTAAEQQPVVSLEQLESLARSLLMDMGM